MNPADLDPKEYKRIRASIFLLRSCDRLVSVRSVARVLKDMDRPLHWSKIAAGIKRDDEERRQHLGNSQATLGLPVSRTKSTPSATPGQPHAGAFKKKDLVETSSLPRRQAPREPKQPRLDEGVNRQRYAKATALVDAAWAKLYPLIGGVATKSNWAKTGNKSTALAMADVGVTGEDVQSAFDAFLARVGEAPTTMKAIQGELMRMKTATVARQTRKERQPTREETRHHTGMCECDGVHLCAVAQRGKGA